MICSGYDAVAEEARLCESILKKGVLADEFPVDLGIGMTVSHNEVKVRLRWISEL